MIRDLHQGLDKNETEGRIELGEDKRSVKSVLDRVK